MSLMPVFGGQRSSFYDPKYSSCDAAVNNHQKQQHRGGRVTAPWAPPAAPHHGTPDYSHHAAEALLSASPSPFGGTTVDWKETAEAYIFKTVLPAGVRREDVRVEVEDDTILKISCESFTAEKPDHMEQNYYHMHGFKINERSRCKFQTAFSLPQDSRVDEIRSTLENGLLTVRVPKYHHHHHVIPVETIY